MFDCSLVVRGAARSSTPDRGALPVPDGTDVVDLTPDFTPHPVALMSPLSLKALATNAATWLVRYPVGSTAVAALRSFSKAVATSSERRVLYARTRAVLVFALLFGPCLISQLCMSTCLIFTSCLMLQLS